MEMNIPNEGMPKIPVPKMGPWVLPFLFIIIAFSSINSFFYQVGPDEVGVVQQFGKYVRTTNPGLQFKLPFGIETVKKVKVTHVFKEEFGFRTVSAGVRSVFEGRDINPGQGSMRMNRQFQGESDPLLEESVMLTGDLNVAMVEWIVQYTVKDPVHYAFHMRDVNETIRNMSEAMMRLVVGDHTINEVLTSGREEIQVEVEKKLQEVLDSYESGISIRNVILQDVTPPNEVKPSFNEVNEARQEKEKLINQAWEEYNHIIPRAKGEAEQKIREAEGYALERINQAKGDAERFTLSWEAYKLTPDVTKKRLYLETMVKVLPTIKDKMIIDESVKGILPLLNLDSKQKAEAAS